MCGNSHPAAEVFDFCTCSISSLFAGHALAVNLQGLGDVDILVGSGAGIPPHDGGEEHGTCHAVGYIVEG